MQKTETICHLSNRNLHKQELFSMNFSSFCQTLLLTTINANLEVFRKNESYGLFSESAADIRVFMCKYALKNLTTLDIIWIVGRQGCMIIPVSGNTSDAATRRHRA
jgi:hypothetical protein